MIEIDGEFFDMSLLKKVGALVRIEKEIITETIKLRMLQIRREMIAATPIKPKGVTGGIAIPSNDTLVTVDLGKIEGLNIYET